MGFFASRWIEKHGAETEKAALSTPPAAPTPKTKWVLGSPVFSALNRMADDTYGSLVVFTEEG
jgi:hypothetical protein